MENLLVGSSHVRPVHVEGHWQTKLSPWRMHVPPFWQGAESHGSGAAKKISQINHLIDDDYTEKTKTIGDNTCMYADNLWVMIELSLPCLLQFLYHTHYGLTD